MNISKIYNEAAGRSVEEEEQEENISNVILQTEYNDWIQHPVTKTLFSKLNIKLNAHLDSAMSLSNNGEKDKSVLMLIKAKTTKEIIELCQKN